MKHTKTYLLLLTATTLLMRGVGVAFSSFLNQKIGPVGVGLYSLLMSVYGLFITFATSGIRLAASRLCTQKCALGKSPYATATGCVLYGLLFGCVSFAVLFFGASPIANIAIGSADSALCLKVLACCLPFIAVSSALGGYFVSQNMLPLLSMISVFEQFVKVALSVWLIDLLLPKGEIYGCVALVVATALGESVSFLIMLLCYWLKKSADAPPKQKVTLLPVLKVALPLGISYYLRNGLNTLEHLLIPKGLKAAGGSQAATLGVYGTIHGLVFPALMLPLALIDSAGELLIPRLTALQAQNKTKQLGQQVSQSLNLCLMYSLFFTLFFWRFSTDLAFLLYQNENLGTMFKILCPMIVLTYMDALTDSMLKGLGCQLASMRYSMIDSVLGVGLMLYLLPKYAIGGYVFVMYFTKLVNVALSLRKLLMQSGATISLACFFGVCASGALAVAASYKAAEFASGALLFVSVFALPVAALFLRYKHAKTT